MTTQIDHLLVSRFGVFVIEVKAMKDWIYGSENDRQWTQAFKTKKFRFRNPIRHNVLRSIQRHTWQEVVSLWEVEW